MAKSNVTATITQIHADVRDVSQVPALIAERLTVIVSKIGMAMWPVESYPDIVRWMTGGAPATWSAWANLQGIEIEARKIATGQKSNRRPFTPAIVGADGSLSPAPITTRQAASRAKARMQSQGRAADREARTAATMAYLSRASMPPNVVSFPKRAHALGGGSGPKAA